MLICIDLFRIFIIAIAYLHLLLLKYACLSIEDVNLERIARDAPLGNFERDLLNETMRQFY